MSRNPTKRRRRGRGGRFGAPWGTSVKLLTALTLSILTLVAVMPQLMARGEGGRTWMFVAVPVLIIVVFGVVSLFCVRGYSVEGRMLRIRRLLWSTPVALHDLREARFDSDAMKGSIRVFGNGGFLVFSGWYRNKRLGVYSAYVTDPARCVVMEFPKRRIVVSPDDPEQFIAALGCGAVPQGEEH